MKTRKRLLAGIVCLFMIALQILNLAACAKNDECSHHFGSWFKIRNATCLDDGIEARKCEHCHEIETSAIKATGHEWTDATCSAPKTCKNCGAKEGSAIEHSFTLETVKPEALKSAATCTEAAVYFKSCSCGAVSTNAEQVFSSGEALGHKDENKDHSCENGCAQSVGEHTDGDDADHLCDYGCQKTADEGCQDANKDGKCDECGAVIGHACIDENKDHICDICTNTISQHTDNPKDHVCDYCGASVGDCVDANFNHLCDYGCSKYFGEHTDGDDDDHKCDYGCKQIADDGCFDYGTDGICDECGAEIEHECVDAQKNHACDICSAAMGDHIDRNFDHVCEYGCGEKIGDCVDLNKDHRCDYGCGATFGEHSDINTDTDHLCDYGCGAVLEACYDDENDGDHNCDLCGNVDVSYHMYGEATCGSPATCSDCGATTGTTLDHIDANHDHICDNGCGKNDIGDCLDSTADADHLCDYGCKAVLEECSDIDTDADHSCDICGKADVTQHNYDVSTAPASCENAAKNVYTCDCGHSYEETVGIALGHDKKGVERQVDGCEYVMEYICQREGCGIVVESETTYHHKHVASIDKYATCQEDGLKIFVCSECGDTSKAPEAIPADSTGHNWQQLGEIVGGVRTDECSVCHTTKSVTVYVDVAEDLTAKDFENEIEVNNANISLDQGVIDKIGDDSVTLSADKLEGDARKELGLTEEQLNEQVGDSPIYNFTINNGTENISDFGENNYVTITLPYELKEGEDVDSIAIWFISDKCAFEDCETENCEDASHRLVSMLATYNNGFVTFKTNHFSYYTVTRLTPAERCALYDHLYSKYEVVGSCTADSYTLEVCIRCHNERITNLVKADGHYYVATETQKVSCTANGVTTHVCSDCGDTYTTTVFATGHAWELEDSVKASCTVDGYDKYGCLNCDEEYVKNYAKVAHAYTTTKVEATCTADGYTLHDCDNCDYSYTDKFVSATGHSYNVVGWVWAADYSSAFLNFACEHDAQHVTSVNADIATEVINGSCSVFVKTVYTATASYNGTEYTDEKSVERGDPNHKFDTSVWKKDKNEHWHECICGARTDVVAHAFGDASVIKAPTCAEAGQSNATCADCGEVQKIKIPATGEHNYVNGFCSECGAEDLQNYYVNLVNSYKNIDGFSIKLQNLSIEIKEQSKTLLESFELIGSIKQLDVADLMLTFADGKIGGAAIGSLVIFNGPIRGENALYNFKAIIENDYVYIQLAEGVEKADKITNIKMSVDTLISSLLENMDVNADAKPALDFIADTVIPAIDTLIELNADTVNKFLEDAFNAVFTFEQTSTGNYLATLDYDKLNALNENLATKTVAELVDFYFGEGKFDSIVDWVEKLISRELSELPAYLDECGLNSDDIIAKINEMCLKMGAPADYDFLEFINGEDCKGVTLGMYFFGDSEEKSYTDRFNDIVDGLREYSVYAMMNEDNVDGMKDGIADIIAALSESAVISFTTDSTGMLTSINVNASEFTYSQNDIEISATFKLELLVNGTVNVTWGDIVNEIESGIVLPNEEMLDGNLEAYYNTVSGTLTYKGNEYKYSNGYRISAYLPMYDSLDYILFTKNCGAWTKYQAAYSEKYCRFIIASITVDGKETMVVVNLYNDEAVELVASENGFTAIFDDGTEKKLSVEMNGSDMAQYFANICFAIFDDPAGSTYYMGEYVNYYYNATLGQYSKNDQHEYVYEYEVEGDSCEDGCKVHVTCANCDYSSTSNRTECDSEYGVKIEFSEVCQSGAVVARCKICGRITAIQDMNLCTSFTEIKDILADDGHVIGEERIAVCDNCGIKAVTREWVEEHTSCTYTQYEAIYVYNGDECIFEYVESSSREAHNYEYSYEFKGEGCDDGYTLTTSCNICGKSYTSTYYGHRYEEKEIPLGELGLCGGYAHESFCPACGFVHNSNVESYCDWRHVSDTDDGYSVYKCDNCNATRMIRTQTSEKDDKCNYTSTETVAFLVGEEVVYSVERKYYFNQHNQKYEFILKGESCADGYTINVVCQDCGESYGYEYSGSDHNTYRLFDIENYSECCDDHYLEIRGCACGAEINVDYWSESFRYDEATQTYICDDCGLNFRYATSELKNGCTVISATDINISIGGKEVFSKTTENTFSSHSFSNVEITEIDGETMLVTSCGDCSEVKSTKILKADFADTFEYTVTPTVSGQYNLSLYSNSNVYVTLYQMVAGQRVQNGGISSGTHIERYSNLIAGTTYVYVISATPIENNNSGDKDHYYGEVVAPSEKVEIGVAVDKNDKYEGKEEGKEESKEEPDNGIRSVIGILINESNNVCQHSYNNFAVLPEGAESCVDGTYSGYLCSKCGNIRSVRKNNSHNTFLKDMINLEENGACYGSISFYSCACGENHRIENNSCAYNHTYNEYYEGDNLIRVDTYTCRKCGLRYTNSYYTVKSAEECKLTYYYTIVVNIGEKLIASKDYVVKQSSHDYVTVATLINGIGSTCEDGVNIAQRCKNCGHEESQVIYSHRTYEKVRIELSEYGCLCGGYAVLEGCACDAHNELSREHSLCDFGEKKTKIWISGILSGSQYNIGGTYYFDSSAAIYTCAVTDPEACAYKIRYARYWLKDEDACKAYEYETWQFGYNEETGEYLYELTFKTGNYGAYHNYDGGNNNGNISYTCLDCGSYYTEQYYYNDQGQTVKYERKVSNTLDDGYDKYYERIVEYEYGSGSDKNRYTSYEYSKRISADGRESYSETTKTPYVGTFGEPGYKEVSSNKNYSGYIYTNERAYVYYKGYEFTIYSYRVDGEYWERYEYTYDFTDGCKRTTAFTNSNDKNDVNTQDFCKLYNTETIKAPTCSQSGEACDVCVICGKHGESYTLSPTDHNWVSVNDSWYYCFTCGLENSNGVSGAVIMEDLTDKYGNGENYVVGYFINNGVDFTRYISLMLADGTEVPIMSGIEIFELEGLCAFAFNKADVEAWAAENGYTDYKVRFVFVPKGSDGSFDYAITFTETAEVGTISGSVSFVDYIDAGETVRYVIAPEENATWIFTSFTDSDSYATLYDFEENYLYSDDDSGDGTNFEICYDLEAGKTYILEVRWLSDTREGNMALLFESASK